MEDNFDNIKRIIDGVVGTPKRDYPGSGGWYEYNCPHCAEENGGVPDDKYNLAVQICDEGLRFHCWKCEYRGRLGRLIKENGSESQYKEYKDELNFIKESHMYTIGDVNNPMFNDLFNEDVLELPKFFRLVNKNDPYSENAISYLKGRGIDGHIAKKFGIGYIGNIRNRLSNRIIIPSYDAYGELNYWVARDYTGNNNIKILNPNVDKKKIVFNEFLINWYEPITLVEGPFDHIVVPNSIPLLGKSIDEESAVYRALIEKSKSLVYIFLDDDAIKNAKKMYKFLNMSLKDRVRLIECPNGYDASDYYRVFGTHGMGRLMRTARKMDEFELAMI